ncbi:EamA family transporter [Corynebacterium ulceribovis]|uniref:EamA family transporter n=1 Tax=Corynebacterium ulceribovis TaxID=487732 RepID=UPI00037AEEBF|nr:EamA family transporter [Corynebacterium ulceribovis]
MNKVLGAALLVCIGSIGAQFGAVLGTSQFHTFTAPEIAALRFASAAVVLAVLFRPNPLAFTRLQWQSSLVFGVAVAGMGFCLQQALFRLPVGIAMTLDFMGPCFVAVAFAAKPIHRLWGLGAFAGVAMIAGPAGVFDLAGYLWGLGAAVFYGLYTVYTARVGGDGAGLRGVAMGVIVASLLTSWFSVPAVARTWDAAPGALGLVALAGLAAVALPFCVDALAATMSSAPAIGVLFGLDPVFGALFAWAGLGQALPLTAWLGIALVVLSGGLLAATSRT